MDSTLLDVFAETIDHLLAARARSGPAIRAYDELFALAVRKVDEIAPVNVSQKAYEAGLRLELKKDLRKYCWFCQKHQGRMKDPERATFHWEHWLPVAEMRNALELPTRPTKKDIVSVLQQSRIVWITKDENARLDQARARATRPDPAKAYKDADIHLRYGWEDCARVPCEWHAPV